MYTGRPSQRALTNEWIEKTEAFIDRAFALVPGASAIWCPCSRCANRRRQPKDVMSTHLCKNGFTADYTRWIYHGEADRMREEVVRARVEDFDADAGVGDWLNDFHEAHVGEEGGVEEPEATAKAYYDMLSLAHKPLHDHTNVSQLDAIGRVMALKAQFSMSRDCYDATLAVIGSLLPGAHIMPKSMYELQKLLPNLRRGVNLSTLRVKGMKSHDFHIWIERLLSVMVRGYVPELVWLVLAELSYFFHQLCAKELSQKVVEDLERMALVLLCD
ncbi:uncharacterized protein [Miscanthus floridulus]|uniref:uncharacterized protein n=1 Tax=Miscanthus floridulus TaxID=154761 RepID=UPI0034581BE1